MRCEHLTGRVSEAQASASVLLAELHEVLDERISASDTAGVATAFAALLPLLDQLEGAAVGLVDSFFRSSHAVTTATPVATTAVTSAAVNSRRRRE